MSSGLANNTLLARALASFSQHAVPATLVAILCGTLCFFILISRKREKGLSKGSPRFRGPQGVPLLGNILQIRDKQWLQYSEWHKTYGPVFSLNFAGQHVLVVGSANMAADLMDRRSHIYSDRPRFIMATEILTGGMNLAFARWGDRWKRMRKAANIGLSYRASAAYTTMQEKEARHFLRGLLTCGGKIDPHIRRSSASMVLSAVYAYPPLPPPSSSDAVHTEASNLVRDADDYVSRMLKAALPGNYLVEFFPWMMKLPMWFPGTGWKRQGYEWFQKDTRMFLKLVDETQTALEDGTRGNCFVSELSSASAQYDLDAVETAWLAGMMFGAGAESLAATFSFFVLAMILFPDVQKKLREEIDTVVGNPERSTDSLRFPTFQDTERMPYLKAVIKEVMRWRPIGPMGVPHRSVEDDIYEGHFIPSGTLIFPNVWAMHQDSTVYTDAKAFKPERFLTEDGATPVAYPDTRDLGHHTFGFGRRACIGYQVANNALAINAAHIVWAFNIRKCADSSGNYITPDPDALLDEGLAVRPMPFDCALEPRSAMVVEMLSSDLSS